ncbi:MAG: arylesterase [Gammaproteobacteria bacterium]|jgi:acyl-CoA thioesterase I
MRNLFYLFLILLVYNVPRPAQAAQPVILVLGDSLSAAHGIERDQGWVQLLQNKLRKSGYPYKVVNASVSGDTTDSGLSRLPLALKQHRPAIVIIELGGNDGLRGLSVDELQRNLSRLIELARHGGAKVLLIRERLPPNLGEIYTAKFSQRFEIVSAQEQVPLVPFFLRGVAGDPSLMQPDGVHPNAKGQPRMLKNVWPILKPLLKK